MLMMLGAIGVTNHSWKIHLSFLHELFHNKLRWYFRRISSYKFSVTLALEPACYFVVSISIVNFTILLEDDGIGYGEIVANWVHGQFCKEELLLSLVIGHY